ncbi:hypothetical protein EBBID32_31430 [Sphingobium indicum BiD32]|uniref:Uncharacterized protein n=1 Tax=Sphingobium indicum BiD32 TaxID=1301087 RepID=N1MTU3_9SPHN|nr:hypothetical protein [Sphingobium indicum]CCW18788.1 hypothetical protein EBBID32_31430 [Sphingobium indicum BiD32]
MSFLNDLLENGGNFIAERKEGSAILRPVSNRDADLESFQTVVRRVRENEGDGYAIFKDHVSSERGGNLVDLLILTVDNL